MLINKFWSLYKSTMWWRLYKKTNCVKNLVVVRIGIIELCDIDFRQNYLDFAVTTYKKVIDSYIWLDQSFVATQVP